jgi:hypothetical protein
VVVANWGNVLRQAVKIGTELLSTSGQKRGASATHPRAQGRSAPTADRARTVVYAPDLDGAADPGEIVWAWVPFEENDGRGKDRPVLLVGRRRGQWVGLMLTSKDHDRDAAEEARAGRQWMDVGTGDWDRERRPSEVRLDRVIVLDEAAIRREGAALDQAMFDRVVEAARELHALD